MIAGDIEMKDFGTARIEISYSPNSKTLVLLIKSATSFGKKIRTEPSKS